MSIGIVREFKCRHCGKHFIKIVSSSPLIFSKTPPCPSCGSQDTASLSLWDEMSSFVKKHFNNKHKE